MINVTSPALSKELFDLSSWGKNFKNDTTAEIYALNKKGESVGFISAGGFAISEMHELVPAYDLGYLLRKLRDQDIFPILSAELYDKWWCKYGYYIKSKKLTRPGAFLGSAPTPEDATAFLAIELIKQGVIKP